MTAMARKPWMSARWPRGELSRRSERRAPTAGCGSALAARDGVRRRIGSVIIAFSRLASGEEGDHRRRDAPAGGRAEEGGVAEGEDPPVGGGEPVAPAGRGGG